MLIPFRALKLLFSIKFIFTLPVVFSQINGRCQTVNGSPIPYVNVTVNGKSYGTVTDNSGYFNFDNEFIKEEDTLKFSHLGFEPKEIAVKNKIIVELIEKHFPLEEVIILNSPSKIKKVGTLKKREQVVLYSNTDVLGSEIGKRINLKSGRKYELLKCYFKISRIDFEEVKLRLNFYNVLKNNQIEKIPVNKKEIIITINLVGDVTVNLNDYELFFDNDFIISLEWIDYSNIENFKSPIIEFASNVFNGPFYLRENVHSPWQEQNLKYNVGLGISALVKSYKIKN